METSHEHNEPVAKHCMPHGWVINWPHPNGGTRPVYHPSSIQPKFGDMKPTMYPVYTSPPPPAEVPLISDEEIKTEAAKHQLSDTEHRHWYGDDYTVSITNIKGAVDFAHAIEQAVRQKAGL